MKTRSEVVVVLCYTLFVLGMASAGQAEDLEAPAPRPRAEVEAVLAGAPKLPADGVLRKLHIVLLADVKDHGPGQHDYPLWQQRWALLLGGKEAAGDSVKQVNLYGPAPEGDRQETTAGADQVTVTTAWKWPNSKQLETADLIVMQCYRSGGAQRTWSEQRIRELESYLSRGGGFVTIHPATYTLRDLSQPGGERVAGLTDLAFDKSIKVRHGPIKESRYGISRNKIGYRSGQADLRQSMAD